MDAMDRLCSTCGKTYGEHGPGMCCQITHSGRGVSWHPTNLFRNAHMTLKDVQAGSQVMVYSTDNVAATGNFMISEKPTSWTYPADVIFHDIDNSTLLAWRLGELAPYLSIQAARYQQAWNGSIGNINKSGVKIDLSQYALCLWKGSSAECILLPTTGSSVAVAVSHDGRDGINCKSCNSFCSYAVPNRGPEFVCYSCRQRGD
jgi:hypothetical protein